MRLHRHFFLILIFKMLIFQIILMNLIHIFYNLKIIIIITYKYHKKCIIMMVCNMILYGLSCSLMVIHYDPRIFSRMMTIILTYLCFYGCSISGQLSGVLPTLDFGRMIIVLKMLSSPLLYCQESSC